MREQARQVVALTPSSRRAQMREFVAEMLGPTALEEPMDDEELALDDEPSAPPVEDDLDLENQLGDTAGEMDGNGSDGPSLLDDPEGGERRQMTNHRHCACGILRGPPPKGNWAKPIIL